MKQLPTLLLLALSAFLLILVSIPATADQPEQLSCTAIENSETHVTVWDCGDDVFFVELPDPLDIESEESMLPEWTTCFMEWLAYKAAREAYLLTTALYALDTLTLPPDERTTTIVDVLESRYTMLEAYAAYLECQAGA